MLSDAILGGQRLEGPVVERCLATGLWHAGAGITLGGKHMANWLVGQIRHEPMDEEKLVGYARKIGADEEEIRRSLREVPAMSNERFQKIAHALFLLSNELSLRAYQNLQQTRFISELARTKDALCESEQRFRGYVENAGDTFFTTTIGGVFTYVAPSWEDLMGEPASRAIGKSFEAYVYPDDIHLCRDCLQQSVRPGRPTVTATYRVRRQDGTTRWQSTKGAAYFDKAGDAIGFMGIARDVTELKKAEDELRENERKLREAQTMTHLGYWEWNIRTGDVEWSDEVYKIFQLDPQKFTPCIDSILAMSPWPEEQNRDKELIRMATESRENGVYEQRFLRPDKTIGHYQSTFQGKYDDKGNLVSIVGTVLDITDRKRAEEFLRQSQERLEQYSVALEATNKALEESMRRAECASRVKSEFLAKMSHELRTPLNAVIGFSEGLLERSDIHPLSEHQKNRLERIRSNGEYLLQLVNEVLDIAKLDAGRNRLQITTFEVVSLVNEVGGFAETLARDKPAVRFIVDLPESLPSLTSDRDKIRQILVNLVSNAFKFTVKGSVTLRARREGDLLTLSVTDTGIGIAEKDQRRLFEQFYQVEQETRGSLEGPGLGLAISRAFAELLDGVLTVESRERRGSTFSLTIPFSPAPNAEPVAAV
jgi:PAS domain S-box-containing protein